MLRNDRGLDRETSAKTPYHMSVDGWRAGTWQEDPMWSRLAEVLERQVDDYPGPSGQIHSRDTAESPGRVGTPGLPVYLLLVASD
jgi:hypothetical protein